MQPTDTTASQSSERYTPALEASASHTPALEASAAENHIISSPPSHLAARRRTSQGECETELRCMSSRMFINRQVKLEARRQWEKFEDMEHLELQAHIRNQAAFVGLRLPTLQGIIPGAS
jgi:hypothetical protein